MLSGAPKRYNGPKELSYSQADKWASCEFSAWQHYVEKRREPPKRHLVLGTTVHRVCELAARLAISEPSRLRKLTWRVFDREVKHSKEWEYLAFTEAETGEFMAEVWKHVVHYAMAMLAGRFGRARFLELEVHSTIDGVPFMGYVDRTDIEHDEEGEYLVPVDIKSGKLDGFDMSKRFEFGAKRGQPMNLKKLYQGALYATSIRQQLGERAKGARYVLTVQHPVKIINARSSVEAEAAVWLRGVWDQVQGVAATQQPAKKTGALCAWCYQLEVCPEGRRKVAQSRLGKVDNRTGELFTVGPDIEHLQLLPRAEQLRWAKTGELPPKPDVKPVLVAVPDVVADPAFKLPEVSDRFALREGEEPFGDVAPTLDERMELATGSYISKGATHPLHLIHVKALAAAGVTFVPPPPPEKPQRKRGGAKKSTTTARRRASKGESS